MNGILGMTDLALSMPLSAEQRDYLETARFSADSLLTLLNDILDFSKIEAGRLDLSPIPFSVRECLDQVAKMFAVPLEAKKLAFSVQVAEDVPAALVGDPDRLRQILLNLIGNAIKFTEQGSVRVSVQRVRREDAESSADVHFDVLHFSVTDTGIGIPADKKGLIFEAFRQADGSMTRKYGGTGLGLTICSRLVELMGGAIRVESAPGEGSTFHFTARFGHTDQDAKNGRGLRSLMGAVNGKMPPSDRSLAILLAEDHVVNQRLATRLLEKRGHQVTVERVSGVRTPIVALTAHSMKGDRERCLAAGMDDYIAKPINPAELIMVVEAAAATASEREAVASQPVAEAG
jgi:CheY-like chemotaxis protein